MTDPASRQRIARIEVHPATLTGASALQRAEWRILADELAAEELMTTHGATTLIFQRTTELVAVHFSNDSGEALARVDLASSTLLSLCDEYVGIVRMMTAEDVPLPRLEALDMAKKVVHDRAARALRAALTGLDASAEGLRRVFSLVVALRTSAADDVRSFRGHGRKRKGQT